MNGNQNPTVEQRHTLQTIDAGHGGGQVLRTALSLAALTGTPIDIRNIRQNRPKPGLQPQHLACVHAVAKITDGTLEHDAIGASHVVFRPGKIRSGRYEFDIGTAGASCLLLQCILPPLLFADKPSSVRIIGGTDVPFSPPSLFLETVFVPALEKMGAPVSLTVVRHGFYPKGGGILDVIVQPVKTLRPLDLKRRGTRGTIAATIQSAQLPNHVAEREKAELQRRVDDIAVNTQSVTASSAGNVVNLFVDYGGWRMAFDALGKIGKTSEIIATEVADAYAAFDTGTEALEPHLLDQLLIYAALAGPGNGGARRDDRCSASGQSQIKVTQLSEHAESNLRIIHELLGTAHTFNDGMLVIQGKNPKNGPKDTEP
ncbi:RNA 3'-phosphate cyclase [Candidatus Micrarchaeota archaeon]|nr:RNA 3'-phosphate cyclase [Candidatus Micrarchaeota archaeon]